MKTFLFIAIVILMLAVIASMFIGFFNMAKEGDKSRAKSNKMMQWRIVLQGLAIFLMFIFALLAA